MNKFFAAVFAVLAVSAVANGRILANGGYGTGAGLIGAGIRGSGLIGAGINGGYGAAPITNAGYVARANPAVSVSYVVPVYNIPIQAPVQYGAPALIAGPAAYSAPDVAQYTSAAAAGSSVRGADNYGPSAAAY